MIEPIPTPVALWSGSARHTDDLVTARAMIRWRRSDVACEIVGMSSVERAGAPDVPVVVMHGSMKCVRELKRMGVRTIVDCHPHGEFDDASARLFEHALSHDMHVCSGRDVSLRVLPGLYDANNIHDFASDDSQYPPASGVDRDGLRLLTVGPDVMAGKRDAAMLIYEALSQLTDATMCTTSPIGRLLTCMDAQRVDSPRSILLDNAKAAHVTGQAEWLSPHTSDPGHWYVIEGSDSAWSPIGAPMGAGLLMGSRPSALVYCATPGRHFQRISGLPTTDTVTDIIRHLDTCEQMGFVTTLVGISVNTEDCSESELTAWSDHMRDSIGRDRRLAVPFFNIRPPSLEVGSGLQHIVRDLAKVSLLQRHQPTMEERH